jgi:LmbE family N-acetylglucosaminyl deacetylase
MDSVGGINFTPAEYVDISAVMDIKKKMLACHVSQVESMREHSNTDIMDMIETQGKFRGFAAGCKFAEAFGRLDAFLRVPHRRLLP